MSHAPATRAERLLFGDHPVQQMRARMSLMALAIYLAFAVVQHTEVLMGLIDPDASRRLTTFNLAGGLMFYIIARSRFMVERVRSITLTICQQLWAQVAIATSYAITGPARGAVLLIMLLVMMYSVFVLRPRLTMMLTASAVTMVVLVMGWKTWTDPVHYPINVELAHLTLLLVVLGGSAAMSVQIARLRSRLQDQLTRNQILATRDELTGLLNRRAVLDQLKQRPVGGSRQGDSMAIALVDLDHFKRTNDTLGHAAGDEVLRRFAHAAGAEIREDDLLARWGGEEFLIALPGTHPETLEATLMRIRDRLNGDAMADIAPTLRVTFSAGVSDCDDLADFESAIARADAALYDAKHYGRDRICRATPIASDEDADDRETADAATQTATVIPLHPKRAQVADTP
ncbi:MAG: GGDEF domain-containing protein [Burkholderiaceae bacterium]